MADVRSGPVQHATGDWLVCRARQDPGCARLLDVAVALSRKACVPCLAILERPTDPKRKLEMSADFLRIYQSIAWRAFGVALILDVADPTFAATDVEPTAEARAEFDALVAEIDAALRKDARGVAEGTRWMIPEDSREAEALVRLTMNRVLRPKGYRRKVDDASALGKTYKGFWRAAEADGVWTNNKASVHHIALESKLNEDIEAPLCQVVDHLTWASSGGGSGAVFCVRVHRKSQKPKEVPPELSKAIGRLEDVLLVRYLDVVLDE